MMVTCRYPIPKEYIKLSVIELEMMEIAFAVFAPPENTLELYINASIKIPQHIN